MRILVTGAAGNVGRHVAAGLAELGADVYALSRKPAVASPRGVTSVVGDLTDPDSLRRAVTGVDAVFLLWPFLTPEGADAAVHALASSARRIVYLSAISVRDEAPVEENGVWGRVEHAIERSGAEWTFLRAGGFATNTRMWADQIRTGDAVRWVYGDAARSLVHERDIADVAVRALTEGKHVGAKYVLTGPEAVTQADQVRFIGEAIGRPLRWEEIPVAVARDQLAAALGDASFAEGALVYWATLVEHPEPVTGTVPEVTGAPARTFAEWARDHAADFRS
jgi:uncharacterized protein YbjT (DUF2867 family)